MIKKLFTILVLLVVGLHTTCLAQQPSLSREYVFESLQSYSGHVPNNVRCMFQDSKGYIWIGTNSELNRYDGRVFEVFQHDPLVSTSISSNSIWGICESPDGDIWLATENGLNRLSTKDLTVRRYFFDTVNFIGSDENVVQGVLCDHDGHIWAKMGQFVHCLDPKTEKVRSYTLNVDYFKLKTELISCPMYQDSHGVLWVGTENGLGYYEPMYDEFLFFRTSDRTQNPISNNRVLSIFEDENKKLWVGTLNGLNLFNHRSQTFLSYYYNTEGSSIVNGISAGFRQNELWISTEWNGVYRFNTKYKQFRHFTKEDGSLTSNQTNSVFRSADNLVWVGTRKGLVKVDKKPVGFYSLENETEDDNPLLTNFTTAVYVENNRVFVGTKFGGLREYNLKSHTRKIYTSDRKKFLTNTISAISHYGDSTILVASLNNLYTYNYHTTKMVSLLDLLPDLKARVRDKMQVNSLLVDTKGNMWIATNMGLAMCNMKTRTVQTWNDSELSSLNVTTLFEDHRNLIIIGLNNGAFYYDYHTNEIVKIRFTEMGKQATMLPVYDIEEDSNGNLWFGTNGGFIKCSGNNFQCSLHTLNKINKVRSLQTDGKELWAGTDDGLIAFNPQTLATRLFTNKNGVKDYEFSHNASCKTSDNVMFFGGTESVTIFKPELIRIDRTKLSAHFKTLQYSASSQISFFEIDTAQRYVLPWNSKNITFSYSAFDYHNPLGTLFRYRYNGGDWIDLNTKNSVTFPEMPFGIYKVELQASTGNEIWSDSAFFTFEILPPFWRTIKFYLIIALIVILITGYLVRLLILRRQKIARRYIEQEMWNRRLENQQQELEYKTQNIVDSINYAKRIQMAIMPARAMFRHILPSSFILYQPKDIVSGDFYWITEIKNRIIVVCADCTGHGVPGAFMSIIGYNLLRSITRDQHIVRSSEILDQLNRSIIELLSKDDSDDTVKDGMDISICAFDKTSCMLEFAGALTRMLLLRNGQFLTYVGDKYPVGLSNDRADEYTNKVIRVQRDDKIYLFSDGYCDQFGGEHGKKLKMNRLKSNILACQHLPIIKHGVALNKQFNTWKGDFEQIDDVLVMGFDFNKYIDEYEAAKLAD